MVLDDQVQNNCQIIGKSPEKVKIIIDSASKLTFLKPSSSFTAAGKT